MENRCATYDHIAHLKAQLGEAERRADSHRKGAMIVMACMIKASGGQVKIYDRDVVGVDPATEIVVSDDFENGCKIYRIRKRG